MRVAAGRRQLTRTHSGWTDNERTYIRIYKKSIKQIQNKCKDGADRTERNEADRKNTLSRDWHGLIPVPVSVRRVPFHTHTSLYIQMHACTCVYSISARLVQAGDVEGDERVELRRVHVPLRLPHVPLRPIGGRAPPLPPSGVVFGNAETAPEPARRPGRLGPKPARRPESGEEQGGVEKRIP